MSKRLRIGIFLYKYHPQLSGGIDTAFVRSILAIVTHAPQHEYIIIANQHSVATLKQKFEDINDVITYHVINPNPPIAERIKYGVKRYLTTPRKQYFVQKLEELNLDILHYPRQEVSTVVDNASIMLTLYDIQHEYYPEFFDEAVLASRRRTYTQSIQNADSIVVATDYTKQTIQEKFPNEAHKVTRIYPGFETNWKKLDVEKAKQQLAQYSLPERFIFYPANPWLHKNHAHLFAALQRLRNQGIVIPLVCTGRLKQQAPATLQQLIIASDLEDIIYDLGYVDEQTIQALYSQAEMLVFPSLFEGFGYPILEAQANGCPVVASNATTLPEVAGEGAEFFNPLDIDDIARALKNVWQNVELKQALREKGFENGKRFEWKTYAEEISNLSENQIKV